MSLINDKKYRRQLIKIYGSFALCPLWFVIFFILEELFPGKFQNQPFIGQVSIVMLVVSGFTYVVFLINFLSSKENVSCMNYYSRKKSRKKKQG